MLTDLKGILNKARTEKRAVAAFNVPNLEMIRAAIQAAEELAVPVILQHAEGHDTLIPLEEIGPIMIDYAKRSSVPIAVHLDHGKSMQAISMAIKLGFTSVMIDASDESFEKNVERTQEVVAVAHRAGVSVEAELGHVFTSSIGGGEGRTPDDERIDQMENIYTDPKLAKEFVTLTDSDCLAIAFGTVHGVYLKDPVLDLERIKLIDDEIQCPLVMHGGSGISERDYCQAIKNGITKINYYTYANRAGARGIEELANGSSGTILFLEDYIKKAEQELKRDYLKALRCFNGI